MIRRSFRIGLTLGVLGGLAWALVKMFGLRGGSSSPAPSESQPWPTLVSDAPTPSPEPATAKAKPKAKAPAKKKPPVAAWVEPEGDACPTTHPVKGKLTSKIFHLPGMLNYTRTHPDRCYRDAKAAEADGLRAAKR